MIPYFSFHFFKLGFLTIQVWGLLVALGFLISLMIIWQVAKRLNLNQEKFFNFFAWVVVAGMVGGRLFFVLFEGYLLYFVQHPLATLMIWQGGLDSFGGFFGAFVVVWYFCKKRKFTWQYLDVLALAFPFGWAVGRIGCLLIHDHWGIESKLFFAIKFDGGARLDMAMLEIVMLLPLLIIFAVKGLKMLGRTALLSSWLFLWYGIGRFLLDFLRTQTPREVADARYWGLTIAQFGCIILVVLGLKLWQKRKHGRFA